MGAAKQTIFTPFRWLKPSNESFTNRNVNTCCVLRNAVSPRLRVGGPETVKFSRRKSNGYNKRDTTRCVFSKNKTLSRIKIVTLCFDRRRKAVCDERRRLVLGDVRHVVHAFNHRLITVVHRSWFVDHCVCRFETYYPEFESNVELNEEKLLSRHYNGGR